MHKRTAITLLRERLSQLAAEVDNLGLAIRQEEDLLQELEETGAIKASPAPPQQMELPFEDEGVALEDTGWKPAWKGEEKPPAETVNAKDLKKAIAYLKATEHPGGCQCQKCGEARRLTLAHNRIQILERVEQMPPRKEHKKLSAPKDFWDQSLVPGDKTDK